MDITSKPAFAWKMIWFGALLIGCYAPVLAGLVKQWATDPDMGHGFLVPCVAGYLAWRRRTDLQKVRHTPSYTGLGLIIWGGAQMILGSLAAQVFIARTAFLISVLGTVLFLGGTPTVRILQFPLFSLIFMIPVPATLYAQITLPLQILASTVAEAGLNWIGIPVLRDGNILELANQRISVVEACSGMRSLLSLAFVGVMYAYFFEHKFCMRAVLAVITVPVAIAANAARVTLTGVLATYRPSLVQGTVHVLEGWGLFIAALAILVAFHRGVRTYVKA